MNRNRVVTRCHMIVFCFFSQQVQVLSWFDDREDRALLDLIPFFESLARADSVITFLKHNPPPGLPSFAALGYPGQSLNEP